MVEGFICKMAEMRMLNNKCTFQAEYDIVITMFGPVTNYSESKLLTVKLF